jgi:putative tricarboxylic transport membrane protein
VDLGAVLPSLAQGFAVALAPYNLLYALFGVTLGTAIGVLPGIGPALTISLLLPITARLDPTSAFIMFAGIYYGGMYGGSTTSILLNTPGETASVVTAMEGYQMARRGRAGAALATAAIGSFIAGNLATLALMLFAPVLVSVALRFGPAEYFALMVLAFTTVTGLVGRSLPKAMFSLFIGLALGLVGIDQQTGQARYTFGVLELLDGFEVVNIAVGLFAVGEVFWVASTIKRSREEHLAVRGRASMTREEWARSWRPWLRGSALGFSIGSLPAGGAEIPTFLSYNVEKRLSRHKAEWGRGAIEGVAGPEAANNAAAGGALMPLLTLGLPTSATAAIMLAAFQQYGLQPGPLLFQGSRDLVWGLIASLYVGNVMLLVLNLPLIRLWVRLLEIPRPLLYAGILIFATLGVWSLSNSVVDLVTMYLIGALGYAMRRLDFPVGPTVLAVVLGPRIEQEFRRALAISQGDPATFVSRPISLGILLVAALVLVGPYLPALWARLRGRRAETRRFSVGDETD